MKKCKIILMLLLTLVGLQAQQTTTKCGSTSTEVCATWNETFTEVNPPVPLNLDDLFASEIGGKIALEIGAWATSLVYIPIVLSNPALWGVAPIGMAAHLGTVGGTMIGVSKASSYHINNWAPYVKYGKSKKNKPVSQGVALSVDVIKVPRNSSRFISISADMRLLPADESEDGHKIIRTKFMDKYNFTIAPIDPSKVEVIKSIPGNQNKSASYTESISIDGSGSIQYGSPSASGGIGYSVSTSKNIADFSIELNQEEGKIITWDYKMGNSYEGSSPREYTNAQDLIIDGVFTKWLEQPAKLGRAVNQIKFANLYSIIDPNEHGPIEFNFESVQQLMHVEIVGRWGIPGAELSGVSVIVPSYYVVSGKIIVTPDPINPENTTITKELAGKTYTYQQFMDRNNAPLPTIVPSIAPGCYAIKNMNSNQYISAGDGSWVVNYYANKSEVNVGEKVNVVYRGKKGNPERDVYALYTADQRYISEPPGDAIFKSSAVNNGELWSFEPKPGANGVYFLKSLNQGKYLSANNNWFQQLGTSFNKNSWEEWSLVPSEGCLNSPYASFENSKSGNKESAIPMTESDLSSTFGINVSSNSSAQLLDYKSKTYPSSNNDLIDPALTQNINEFSIEAWINNGTVGSEIQAIVSSDGPEFLHFQMSGSQINNAVYFEDGSGMMLPQIPALSPGWHHVAISASSGDSRVYIDGEQYGTTVTQQFGKLKPSNNFRIGQGWQGERQFNGKIANLRLWNKSKSKAEINASMNNQTIVSSPNLIYQSLTSKAGSFATVADCPSIPSNVTSGVQSVTIEGWIKNQDSDFGTIQSIASSTQGEFVHFQLSADPNTNNVAYLNDGRNIMLPCVTKLSPGWHHVAIVVESGNTRVLVDGVQKGAANTTTFTGLKDTNSAFIGKGWQGERLFKGMIANLRIWKNKPMTNAEIIEVSTKQISPNTPGLAFQQF